MHDNIMRSVGRCIQFANFVLIDKHPVSRWYTDINWPARGCTEMGSLDNGAR